MSHGDVSTAADRAELESAGVLKPRQPSVADRRRIMDELEARYDIKAERYAEADSDQLVAVRLDVPRAWVTEVRCQLFGSRDENEQAETVLADAEELRREIKQLVGRAGQLEGKLEALVGRLDKVRRK